MRIPVVLAFVSITSAAGAVALAEEAEDAAAQDARANYQQGLNLYAEGKFELAAIAFERAYELRPHFKILWNIAQVENELEHYAAARSAYVRYLDEGGAEVPADRREEAKAEIARLDTLVGTISIDAAIEGAAVFVDGKKRGQTPFDRPIPLDLGEHEITVEKDGQRIHREVVRIAGGREVIVTVKDAGGELPGGEAASGDGRAGGKRLWTWVALGIGGAAGIAGGVMGGIALSKKADIDAQCEGKQCPAGTEDDADRVKRLALGADVLFGVAAAGVVAGVVLFFVEPRAGSERAVSVTPVVADGTAGLVVGGRF
jgi:hypothetical protein